MALWNSVEIGDSAPPYVYEVTAEKIADFCRIARYENLVYTNQPAARETGLPGIIAPPAMVFVYAPVRLSELLAVRSLDAPELDSSNLTTVKVLFSSPGVMVGPGDVITSVTSVRDKSRSGSEKFVTVQVSGYNQRDEPVADYCWTYICSETSG